MTDWERTMTALLGKRVTVTYSTDPELTITGTLHTFSDMGEVCVRAEDTGEHTWAWPNLHIKAAS